VNNSRYEELPIFMKWMDFLGWFFQVTEKFPKRARHTFVNRMQSIALDIVEDLVEARYSRSKGAILKRANLRLEKLRVLLRLSFSSTYLSPKAFEQAAKDINEVGAMLGGWRKSSNPVP
jgi:hypothetical protein